ncbi:MAG: polymerase III protein [Candidatus Magasanikbacteria bacterium GW2011_GWC2_34_16]|uniref:DNA polymerase III subunit delta n=2 Tax=Candidatus Magasanikiibacteriota TaxID=1752731 RepID=A0A0G0JVW2_9BACT|nr:MAG: polymerase III protein [Candidatus Magasanikbacteria bacterium GW2011_GWC2_34_16]KKQ41039.1 MAG: polymerase III protein [Candidatus Magasanikbacteria bacterium GW2011_GWA2_37_8]
MIIYIYGEDTFRSRQYLREQVAKFKQARDPQGYNVVFLDSAKAETGKVLGELVNVPFLAEKRMIVLENILTNNDKELLGEIITRVEKNNIPESNVVIFWQGKGKSKVKEAAELEKLLQKEKYAREFAALTPSQLSKWVADEIKTKGGVASSAALQFLVANTKGDIWYLNSLIEQLVSYAQDREIQLADVQLFLEEKIDDNVFNMVEAIVNGNRKQAFKLLNEQRRLGEDDFKLFGLIVWQFRILLALRALFDVEDNMTSDAMAKKLKLHPFVVKKNLALVKRYTLARLKDLYDQLLQIDIKTKTGQGDQSMLLDLFVGRV